MNALANDAIRQVLIELDKLKADQAGRSADFLAGVDAARNTVRGLLRGTRRYREQLEPGSLAEKVVAFCRIRPTVVLTDDEIHDRFAPDIPPQDIFTHLAVAVRDEYLETTVVVGRQRGYRRHRST